MAHLSGVVVVGSGVKVTLWLNTGQHTTTASEAAGRWTPLSVCVLHLQIHSQLASVISALCVTLGSEQSLELFYDRSALL